MTGGAGFIGSHLVDALLALGQRVRVLDNFSTGSKGNLEMARGFSGGGEAQLEICEGDIRDAAVCAQACHGIEIVSHQAALGSVPRSLEDPQSTHGVNVDGFVNLALSARDAGVETFIFASSSSVYGDATDLPQRESAIGRALSPYAASKRIDEIYAEVYHRAFGLRTIGLRYFNVVGPRQRRNGPYAAVVPRFIAALQNRQSPEIYGDGLTSRDFCPVDNVVRANLLAGLASSQAAGEVFNVALGQSKTLIELFEMLRSLVAAAGIDCGTIAPTFGPFRPGDLRQSHAALDRAREELGYTPGTSLEDALRATVAWATGEAHVQAP